MNIKSFFGKYVRVWHLLRKPSIQEFKSISKVSAIGILLIGLVGFIIAAIINLF